MSMPNYPQPSQQAMPVPQGNGLGTAGFVTGLIGLIFSFIPVIGIVAWPLVIIGVVLSGVGVYRANSGQANNAGMAIAGLACSIVGLVFCLLWVVAWGATW